MAATAAESPLLSIARKKETGNETLWATSSSTAVTSERGVEWRSLPARRPALSGGEATATPATETLPCLPVVREEKTVRRREKMPWAPRVILTPLTRLTG